MTSIYRWDPLQWDDNGAYQPLVGALPAASKGCMTATCPEFASS